jgi:DNA-binding GntR family transcriptional regulator
VGAAYDQLRELIVWGKLAPGSRIIETDIATRLGVSRTPVRAALQRLQQEGFIVGADNGQQARLSVAPLTLRDARELFMISAEVEGLAARFAAEELSETTRTELSTRLREINSDLQRLVAQPDPDTHLVFDMDRTFHGAFFEAGAGPRLRVLHRSVKPQAERYVRLYVTALIDNFGDSLRDHEAIASAIEAGEAQRTKDLVLEHWRSALSRLAHVIERLGERGTW